MPPTAPTHHDAEAAALRLALISARFPPRLDGIGDYTARLAHALTPEHQVRVLTAEADAFTAPPGVDVVPCFRPEQRRSVAGWLDALDADPPDWVVLQFNQFGFGRWGLNPWVPRTLARLKRRHRKLQVAVMFHERYVPATTARFRVMRTWQVPQFRAVGRIADRVFFSIQNWAERYATWFPHRPVVHLPVGSNLPRVPINTHDARTRLGFTNDELIVGVFGHAHGTRTLSTLAGALDAASTAAGRPARLLYVGPDHAAVRAALPHHRVTADGPAPAEEASQRLSAMDLYLSDHTDGVSTRRGSLMAALQHGLPCVGTDGESTGAALRAQNGQALRLVRAGDPTAFAQAAADLASDPIGRASLGQAAADLYHHHYDWPVIAQRLIQELSS